MTGLHQALQDFETTLQVDDKKKEQILKTRSQQQCLSQSSNPIQHFLNIDWSLEFQKFRISSRIKKLRKAVTEIKTRLDELESLLRNDEELRQRIKIREASKSGSIKASRRKGAVLHSFLTKQWPCSCQSPHDSARVYLKRKAISEDQVVSLFSDFSRQGVLYIYATSHFIPIIIQETLCSCHDDIHC